MFVGFCRKRGGRTIATRQNTLASLLCATVLVGGIPVGKADTIPIPPKRPETIPREQHPASNTNLTPSSCQLRLGEIAIFKALPPIAGPGECFAADVVAVDGMLLADKRRVIFSPAITLQCPMAEAVAKWIAADVAPSIATLGSSLQSVETVGSFDCRPRNGVAGAQLSEHGHANALDIRAFKLANGAIVELNNANVSKLIRERFRKSACAHFSTVLGNGADAYHDTHVHIDLMERSNQYKICQWDVLDPAETAALAAKKVAAAAARASQALTEATNVPLPRARPAVASAPMNNPPFAEPVILREGATRTRVALSSAGSLASSPMAYVDEQTIAVGPWTIATSWKGDKFDSCSMSRSAAGLDITLLRTQDELVLLLASQKWKLQRGKAYPVRLVAGSRSIEAKAFAEPNAVTIALVDRTLNGGLRTADVLEVKGEGATLRVPLDGSTAALARLELCFDKNSQTGTETNPFVAPSRKP